MNIITPHSGLSLREYSESVILDIDALRELIPHCATSRTLGALLRLTRAQFGSLLYALERDIGEIIVYNDGTMLRTDLATCPAGKTERCCGMCPYFPPNK